MSSMVTSREMVQTPSRFRTIMADPPWDIGQKRFRGAQEHYPVFPVERIKALPVAGLAEENAHLYLWVVNGGIREGIDVMEAWRFKYRSPLMWTKPRVANRIFCWERPHPY